MQKNNLRKFLSQLKQKAKRVIYRIQGKQILHFIHIGKTGGSAVKHTIKGSLINKEYVVYLHPHRVRLKNIPKGEKVIFFLRDPIARFISGFYSRQRQGKPRYFSPWNKEEKIAFEEFSTPNELAMALSSTDENKRKKAQFAMENIEHVRNLYMNWFESEDYFKSRVSDVFFIGFQEQLTKDFEDLKSKIGLSKDLKLPNDDIQAHRNPKQLDKALEDEAIVNLKVWYKDDFHFISLCKQLISNKI